jgi:hypothetical protein
MTPERLMEVQLVAERKRIAGLVRWLAKEVGTADLPTRRQDRAGVRSTEGGWEVSDTTCYFLISGSEDGEASCQAFHSKEAILQYLVDESRDWDKPIDPDTFLSNADAFMEGLLDLDNMHPRRMLIKGNAIKPVAKRVVGVFEVE